MNPPGRLPAGRARALVLAAAVVNISVLYLGISLLYLNVSPDSQRLRQQAEAKVEASKALERTRQTEAEASDRLWQGDAAAAVTLTVAEAKVEASKVLEKTRHAEAEASDRFRQGDAAAAVTLSAAEAHVMARAWELGGQAAQERARTQQANASAVIHRSRFLCFSIVRPKEPTRSCFVRQLRQCDGYLMFSTFSDPSSNTVRLYETLDTNRINGYLNLTVQLHTIWEYIRKTIPRDRYDWVVKVDPDSYIRPRRLANQLAILNLDSSGVYGIGGQCMAEGLPDPKPRLQGAFFGVSAGALFDKQVFHDLHGIIAKTEPQGWGWFEDYWATIALRLAGAQILMLTGGRSRCCLTISTGSDLVSYKNFFRDSFETKQIRESIFRGPATKMRMGLCAFFNDLIVAHPVKETQIYEALQSVDPDVIGSNP